MDENKNYITITDENGTDFRFELLDYIIYKNKDYVVLLEDDPNADEVTILQIEAGDSEDIEIYTCVDNPRILRSVFEIFKERNKDIFDFNG